MSYNFSENIQRGIIYLLKHDRDFFSQIVGLVKSDYFEYPSYGLIFDRVKAYFEKYKTLPSDDLLIEDIRGNLPKGQSISEYEDDILQINKADKSIHENRDFVLDLIEDFARKEAFKHAIKESVVLLKEDRIPEIYEKIKAAMIVSRNVDVGQLYFDDLNNRFHRVYDDKETNKYKTVFSSFNDSLDGGLNAKELALVVAPPGVGKSLYLVNQGAVSLKENKNVLYISLEMSEDKIAQRFDTVLTRVPIENLKRPEAFPIVKQRLGLIKETYADARLVIKEFPAGTLNVNQIRALLVQLKLHNDFRPDIILVDYLELLRPNRQIDAEYQAQQRIADELRGLAMEQNVLVWTATQTNRAARRVEIITDAELGDSYGKIRPADWAISLNQSPEEYDRGEMRVYVMKARDSKQHYKLHCAINYKTLVMSEREEQPRQEEAGNAQE